MTKLKLGLFTMIVSSLLIFTSCENKETPNGSIDTASIIGVWNVDEETSDYKAFEFKTDQIYTIVIKQITTDSIKLQTGTYSLSEDLITLSDYGSITVSNISETSATFNVMDSESNEELLEVSKLDGDLIVQAYDSPTEINDALAEIYNMVYVDYIMSEEVFIANLLSDDMFGGGDGAGDAAFRKIDQFSDIDSEGFLDLWEKSYSAINNANGIIESMPALKDEYTNEDEYNQILGEAHFMRAYMYIRMARLFGALPLILSVTDAPNTPRATLDETYGAIISDLKASIEVLPESKVDGKPNKWVAEAYMARVFLFYTGYANKTSITLADETEITKTNIIAWLEDCTSNSGYALVSDFRNLWPYSYCNSATTGNYYLAVNNGLNWAGQDGETNTETMFSIQFGEGSWDNGNSHTNRLCLYQSHPAYSRSEPFGNGWGLCPISSNLWNDWPSEDIRRIGSIIDMNNPDEGEINALNTYDRQETTGLMNKKYTHIQFDDGNGMNGMFAHLNGYENNYQFYHAQDFILMRYADVLLMHSELTESADGLNQVRARAGLSAVAYSLDNLKNERKYELAFEGIRWYDILRWNDVTQAISAVNGTPILNGSEEATYQNSYPNAKNGLLPIPTSIIDALGIHQNPGW